MKWLTWQGQHSHYDTRSVSREGCHKKSSPPISAVSFFVCVILRPDAERLNQFFDELTVIDEILWAAVRVGQGDGVWIEAQLMVDGREDLLDVDWSVLSNFPKSVGSSDVLAVFHAAASEEE